MISFLFALALHFKSGKMEGRVNLLYMQVVYGKTLQSSIFLLTAPEGHYLNWLNTMKPK